MKNILVIGATGQIGSELTLELRKRYGDDHVVDSNAFIRIFKKLKGTTPGKYKEGILQGH